MFLKLDFFVIKNGFRVVREYVNHNHTTTRTFFLSWERYKDRFRFQNSKIFKYKCHLGSDTSIQLNNNCWELFFVVEGDFLVFSLVFLIEIFDAKLFHMS